MHSESGGGVQGGSDSVGEDSSDEGLVTTNPRVWTSGSLVLAFICGFGSAREVVDEHCEVPAFIVVLSGCFAPRIGGGACDCDEL